jgi:hypothetical protein
MKSSLSRVDLLLLGVIVALTLSTGYIHSTLGGIMLTLNAAGYLGLAVLTVGSAAFFRQALPLVLIALAGYAAVTIVGWLIMGPYYDVAYLAKGIEIVLIGTIAVTLWRMREQTRDAIASAVVLAFAVGAAIFMRGRRSEQSNSGK